MNKPVLIDVLNEEAMIREITAILTVSKAWGEISYDDEHLHDDIIGDFMQDYADELMKLRAKHKVSGPTSDISNEDDTTVTAFYSDLSDLNRKYRAQIFSGIMRELIEYSGTIANVYAIGRDNV